MTTKTSSITMVPQPPGLRVGGRIQFLDADVYEVVSIESETTFTVRRLPWLSQLLYRLGDWWFLRTVAWRAKARRLFR